MQLAKILLFFVGASSLSATWVERKAEGWAWYEDPRSKAKIQTTEIASPSETMAEVRNHLDDLRAQAMLTPTDEALLRYMKEQQRWISQSVQFSRAWNRILLDHPELDPASTDFSTTQYGRRLQKELEQSQRETTIHDMSQTYGLFLLYEGANRSSQSFASVVRTFADKYSWSLIGISVDGVMLSEIPLSQEDRGFAAKIGVQIFPALIAFDNQNKAMIPLAFGLQSLDQIERNVFTQYQHLTQEQK